MTKIRPRSVVLHGFQGLGHAVGVVLGLGGIPNAAAQEDVEDLADAVHRDSAIVELIEQHALGRRHGVIVAIGGARETAGRAGERPRDHAAHLVRSAQNLARGLAHLVQFPERDHFLMRGDLEDAVGRRVDDRRAGAHVLLAQFLDDLGAGGGLVAERPAADAAFELAHHLGREAVRVQRERLGEVNADHFPMAGGGVFAGRSQGAVAVSAGGRGGGSDAGERLDVAEAEARKVGQLHAANAGDVAQRVAARVAILRGVRHLADADAVENDPDDAGKRHNSTVTSVQAGSGSRMPFNRASGGELPTLGIERMHSVTRQLRRLLQNVTSIFGAPPPARTCLRHPAATGPER